MHTIKAEDPPSHLQMTSAASSALGSLPSAKASLPRSQIHEPRTLTTALSGAVTGSVSAAGAKRDEDTSDTSELPSDGFAQTPPYSKCGVTRTSNPSSYDSVATKDRLTSSTGPHLRCDSLFKSSTFSYRDRDESILPDPSPSGETRYGGTAVFSIAQTWPRPCQWRANVGLPLRPVSYSPNGWSVVRAELHQESEDDNTTSIGTPFDSSESSSGEIYDPDRPYTSSLGVPAQWDRGSPFELSVISDAGDQQQLRQKRALAPGPDAIHEESKSEERVHSFPATSRHKLQSDIFNALVQTRSTETYTPDFGFLPKAQLCRLVNPDSVARELMKDLSHIHTAEQIKTYADSVCREMEVIHRGKPKIKSFRKIFALLVLAETSSSIPLFLEEDVSDLDLPLASLRNGGTIELHRKDPSGKPSQVPLKCFRHQIWSPSRLWNFEKYQWIMLAPFFSQDDCGDVKHYILRNQHILPFVASHQAEGDDAEYHGGFGKVFMVRIHEEHHNFRDKKLCDRGFAIKQLYESDRESFKKEVNILKKFSGERSHKHIVSLLATYEQFNKFHLIFYRAEGNLFKHWKEIKHCPAFNYGNVLWVAEQCAGIADGLLRLHRHLTFAIRRPDTEEELARKSTGERRIKIINPPCHRERTDALESNDDREQPASPVWAPGRPRPTGERRPRPLHQPHSGEIVQVEQYGRHGDINPGNILWYDDSHGDGKILAGTLKICDFGQAELNSLKSRTRQLSVANTMTYRPPECDLQPKIIRQSYDIWCLGCVYLEFVTWVLGGDRLLNKFGVKRKTRDIFLNNQLTDTFFQVVRNPDTNHPGVMIKPAVTKFIDELHRHPNCTEYFHEFLDMIQHNMLVVESSHRKSCEEVRKTLDDMYRRCRNDEDYATTKNPWCTTKLTAEPLPHSVEVEMTEDAEQVIAENLPLLPVHPDRPGRKLTALGEQRSAHLDLCY